MAKNGPNKTVARARKRIGGFPLRIKPASPFVEWLSKKARDGVLFKSESEARAAYAKEVGDEG